MKPAPENTRPSLCTHPLIERARPPVRPVSVPLDFKSRTLLVSLAVAFTRQPRQGLRQEGTAFNFRLRE